MANRAHLVSLRGGSRGQATTLVRRLEAVFANAELDAIHKLHELVTKHQALYERYQIIEDLDQQIYALTQADALEAYIAAVDEVNIVYQDALSLYQHRINVIRREIEAADPDRRRNDAAAPGQQGNVPAHQVIVPARATSRPKITLPRFNGEILQWRQFWQAFQAEIHSDDTLANINKFNTLWVNWSPTYSARLRVSRRLMIIIPCS
ncbi:hypothetical protein DAPPUDRAFT_118028 [Daphnia pulex]|uniref:Uncharacterized protein n=1 Tax=Daphnia pulex TaxID=6669 RepID=E9HUH6_DAPPU|nr:hypothetical protein DAPPUDRAFT_118028 [Daphnia pulex]|eukprot:EFX64606.1 hypothetical protein DAPPUDRAFT_118028 [Daphnia pulex]